MLVSPKCWFYFMNMICLAVLSKISYLSVLLKVFMRMRILNICNERVGIVNSWKKKKCGKP